MRSERDLTARDLLDAVGACERLPSRPRPDTPRRSPLEEAAGRARLFLRVHRTQMQREVARVDRALGRAGVARARTRVHAFWRDDGRTAPTPAVGLHDRPGGAPRPEVGLGVLIAANAPPVAS
jgi:hypothetical protein